MILMEIHTRVERSPFVFAPDLKRRQESPNDNDTITNIVDVITDEPEAYEIEMQSNSDSF